MNSHPFTACLVAGGKSARMGRDKAGVEFRGEPLWRHQLRTLRETGADEILISGRSDSCYANGGIRIVADEMPGLGPLGGIHSVLGAASHPLVLVLGIDMPFMTTDYLLRIVAHCGAETGAVPERGGFYEGLAAVYPKSACGIASIQLRSGRYSLQRFVSQSREVGQVAACAIDDADEVLFKNINTPLDLAEVSQ